MKNILSFKKIKASVAQILLVVIIMPYVSVLLKLIIPDDAATFFMNLIQEVPVLGLSSNIVLDLISEINEGKSISIAEFFYEMMQTIDEAYIQAIIIGMCIYACKTLGTIINMKGVAAIQTLVGVLFGCIVVKGAGLNVNAMISAMMCLMIVDIVITVVAVKGQWLRKILSILFGISLQSITAAYASAYVAVLAFIFSGNINSFKIAVALLGVTLFPLLALLIVDYLIFTLE